MGNILKGCILSRGHIAVSILPPQEAIRRCKFGVSLAHLISPYSLGAYLVSESVLPGPKMTNILRLLIVKRLILFIFGSGKEPIKKSGNLFSIDNSSKNYVV